MKRLIAYISVLALSLCACSRRRSEHAICGEVAHYSMEQRRVIQIVPFVVPCKLRRMVGHEPAPIFELYNSPDTRGGGRHEPVLVADIQKLSSHTPEMTIVTSVYNAEQSLMASLPALFTTTTGPWEIIFILDACYDSSMDVILKNVRVWLETSTCLRVRIILQPTAVWEVSSDNIGMRVSSPSMAYILVQPDNILLEKGWNKRMLQVLETQHDVFAVSGRCGHSFLEQHMIGRCGSDVGLPLPARDDRTTFVVSDTVNRGPLMLRSKMAQRLGFLDENAHLLENDDHDLMARAKKLRYKAGYLPIEMYAPMDLSTRKNPATRNFTPPDVKNSESLYREYRLSLAENVVSELQLLKQNLST